MKKNRMMRLASVLLVLVLLTTSVISGTYAKYVTEGTATDTARVAKWGVSFTTSSDLFQTEYAYDDKNFMADGKVSVKTTTEGQNLVAPGTSGNAYSFTTTGTPEVSYIVTFDLGETFESVFLGGSERFNNHMLSIPYRPVQLTVSIGSDLSSETFVGEKVDLSSWAIDQYASKIEACAYYYDVTDGKYYWTTAYNPAGATTWTAYTGDGAPTLSISWNWAFSSVDGLDTALGNLAAKFTTVVVNGTTYTSLVEGSDYNLEIVLPITATATQVD